MDQQKIQELISQSIDIKCEKCQNNTFKEVILLKKLSKLLTGQNKDTLFPIPIFVCSKCGVPIEEYLPNKAIEKSNIIV